jgi:hypothetical protein
MSLEVAGPAPPGNRPESQAAAKQLDTPSLPPAADIEAAYIVIVVSPYGTPRRRPYLNLHHAAAAVSRARGKGQRAWLVLCKLEPVAADLDGEAIE